MQNSRTLIAFSGESKGTWQIHWDQQKHTVVRFCEKLVTNIDDKIFESLPSTAWSVHCDHSAEGILQ